MQDWTSHDWYPMSTCLTANTLTSARATSVLTHLIKMYTYRKKSIKNIDKIEQKRYNKSNKKVNFFIKIKGGNYEILFLKNIKKPLGY